MMSRRTFQKLVAALGVMATVPLQALAKTGAIRFPKQHGLYAVFGFSEHFMKSTGSVPFYGISTVEGIALIEKYGIRDMVSGVTYVKIGALTVPSADGDSYIAVGGRTPRTGATFIAFCRDGKILNVVKDRIGNNLDVVYAEKYRVPAELHTIAFKTLFPSTGILGNVGPSVWVP